MESGNAHSILNQHLRQLRWRLLRIGAGSATSWGVAVAITCLLFGIWIDLVFELSPELRKVVIGLAALSAAVLILLKLVGAWRAGRADAMACRLDRTGNTAGEIRSGSDLLRGKSTRPPLTRGLVELAVERAVMLAGGIAARRAVPLRPLVIASCGLGTMVGVVIAMVVTARPMMNAEYWRFCDPYGDHPPYSRVSFNVEPTHGSVVYGGSQEIEAVTSGAPVERLDLIVLTRDEKDVPTESNRSAGLNPAARSERDAIAHAEVLPMFAEPGGIWRAAVTGITTPTTFFVRCQAGRSKRFQLGVITLPKLEAVRFRITPPAYTNRGAYDGALPPNGITGLPGTQVQVWAKSNRPLAAGRIDLQVQRSASGGSATRPAGTSHDMVPIAPGEREVTGVFTIHAPGKLEIRVRDVDGQESQDALVTSVGVLNDERPFVRLMDPPSISLATPSVVVPVAMAAEDDYGISRVSLFRSLNDSRALAMDFAVPTPAPTRHNPVTALALPTYGLRPGDEIKLFARVEDNDPAGAKGSESPVAMVRIISQEEYERLVMTRQGLEVLQAKYEKARRQMEQIAKQIEELQKQLEKTPPDSPLAKEMRDKLASLAEKMRKEAANMRKSAESKLPFDIDKKMNEHLKKLAEKLQQAAKEVDEFAKSEPAPTAGEAKEGLDTIAEFVKGKKQEYEKETTEPLDQLAKVYRLMEDQNRFTALYQRQKDLADRLDSLKGKDTGDDPLLRGRMRDMESEQYRIREDMRGLLQDIAQHVQQLPEDGQYDELRESATAFVNGVKDSGATDAMSDAEAGLAAFSGTRGAQSSREAEQILAKFISKCEKMGQQGKSCLKFAPGLGGNLGNTVEQLLAGAGLSTGENGMGSGSGYSAQSSTLDNVGLFGQLPALGGNMGGDSRDSQSALFRTGGHEGNFERGEPGRVDPTGSLRPSGSGQNVVPAEYQQRVGEYFERITDEIGQKNEKNDKGRK